MSNSELETITERIKQEYGVEDAAVNFSHENRMAAFVLTIKEDLALDTSKEIALDYVRSVSEAAKGVPVDDDSDSIGSLWETYTLGVAIDIKGDVQAHFVKRPDENYILWINK